MNTKTLLPLTAAALFVACSASMLLSARGYNTHPTASTAVADHVVTLPTLTVHPEAADLAAYRASQKVVDLATVTVRPDAMDLAAYVASMTPEIVDLPAVTVRPSVEDVETVIGVVSLAGRIGR